MKPSYLCHISYEVTVFKNEREGSSGGGGLCRAGMAAAVASCSCLHKNEAFLSCCCVQSSHVFKKISCMLAVML